MLKHKIPILLIIILLIIVVFNSTQSITIIARYQELPPLPRNVDVFYKGLKIGRISKKKLGSDALGVLVYMSVDRKILMLPINTTAKIILSNENKKQKTYVDIMYPSSPKGEYLKNGSVIQGTIQKNLDYYIDKYSRSGLVDKVVGDFAGTSESVTKTTEEIQQIAKNINLIILENRTDIRLSFKNIRKSTENIEKSSEGLSRFLNDIAIQNNIRETTTIINSSARNIEQITKKNSLTNTFDNVNTTTKNLNDASMNIKNFTESINKSAECFDETLKKANCTIDEVSCAAKNVSHMTTGISDILSKKFAFLKLTFGHPGAALKNKPACNKCRNNASYTPCPR